MSPGRQFNVFHNPIWSLLALVLLATSSCRVVKKYQRNIPFVYKTEVRVNEKMPASEKQQLVEKLQNQLDDSLKTQTITYAGVYHKLIKPPSFDTVNVLRSVSYMDALLHSMGYFYPQISWQADTNSYSKIRQKKLVKKGQYHVVVKFDVKPGKQHRYDSIGIALTSPELQELALKYRSNSVLKKNQPYSLRSISDELDRHILLFRNNGYYKINKDDVYAEVDTVVAALIDPNLDPFEQIRLLDSLRKKSENPTINVVIKQRNIKDSSHLYKFRIGKVTVYPDQQLLRDSGEIIEYDTTTINKIRFVYSSNRFKLPFFGRHIFLLPDSVYSQHNYFRTVNGLNRLGAWQNVDLSLQERYDSIPQIDANLRLYPASKQSLNIDFEASRNIGDYLTTGQLFGIGINVKLLNRNAYREAIQTSTNARFGIELGANIVQTLQASLSHSIYFPRFITPFFEIKPGVNISNPKTIYNINGAYTIRRELYDVQGINTSWGYEWTKKFNWQFIPINIEFNKIIKRDSFKTLEEEIPSLKYAFADGFILGMIGGINYGWSNKNKLSFFKIRLEESGALFGLGKVLDEQYNLRRFFKIDAEMRHFINFKRTSLAFRAFIGYGYAYGKFKEEDGDIVPEYVLPFFKAYFAGGPYSMRAWQVRRLGPGSTDIYDPPDSASQDRFGNMLLEANFEYRFDITRVAGIKVKSAIFFDIGNIWTKEVNAQGNLIPEAQFAFNRLYKDLAVAGGTSLRFDFDFFLIRLDWSYKIKNPLYSYEKAGWLYKLDFSSGQFQLGIGYPF